MKSMIGKRRHRATFQRHNGNADAHGQPTYHVADDWDTVVDGWWCQLVGVKGGEFLRGRQVTAQSSFVLYGEHTAVSNVRQSDRILINGMVLGVLDVTDMDGMSMEMAIDAKEEA